MQYLDWAGESGRFITAQGTVSDFLWAGFWGVSCLIELGLGWFLRFFRLADPPRSVPGHDLGNRVAVFRARLFFVVPTPPLGAGGVLDNIAPPTVAQNYAIFFSSPFRWYNFASPLLAAVVALLWVFAFSIDTFSPRPPIAGDVAVVLL